MAFIIVLFCFVLLSAFVGSFSGCKHKHAISNVKMKMVVLCDEIPFSPVRFYQITRRHSEKRIIFVLTSQVVSKCKYYLNSKYFGSSAKCQIS
jgi:hypothetical protein